MFGLFGGNPSRDQFAALLMKEAKRAGIATAYEYDEKEFTLKREGGRLFLGNLYATYCQANSAHKKKLLGNFVETMRSTGAPDSFEEVGTRLIAVIRERALFAFTDMEMRITGNGKPIDVVSEPLSAWYLRALVVDSPGSVAVVGGKQLEKWGVSAGEAMESGLVNLRAHTVPKFVPQNGFYAGTWNDDYDSSRTLVPGLFDDLGIDGDPVVVIPNRLSLLVAGSRQPEALRAMLARAEEIAQTIARPQNPAPLVIRDGEISDFRVPKDSPIFHEVQRAHGLAALMYYREQKELIDKIHEKSGKDVFVPKYILNKLDNGSYQSCCVWSKGAVAMLPATDVVVLHDPTRPEAGRTLGMIPLEKLISIAGDLMLDTELFPTRYYVSKFPDADMLAKLLG